MALRHLGSVGVSAMVSTGPDTRSDELVLAAATQRYVRREIDPLKTAVESWGSRLDQRLVWLDDARQRDMEKLTQRLHEQDSAITGLFSDLAATRIELHAAHRDLVETARVLDQVRHDSLSARWRRFVAWLLWWRR